MVNEGPGTAGDDPLADLRADLAHRGELGPAELADRLQADQARRWRAGRGVPAEAYLDGHPRVRGNPGLVIELILGEILLRRERGERPDPAEYARRFPALAEALGGHLQLDRLLAAEETTSRRRAADEGPTTLGESAGNAERAASSSARAIETVHPTERGMGRGATVRYFGVKAGILADSIELRRFRNEAEAIALLDHPGLVPIYEVGEHEGQQYFSMKLVPGGSLADLPDGYRSDPRSAAGLVADAAEAVAHAHARGVLHRDLKPPNILIDAEGRPLVTDFGLAKRVEGGGESTASGLLLGTPAYMAPEQASGRRGAITTATDIHGLGAVLYALLTGKGPFVGDSAIETLDAVRTTPPEPPRRLNGRVPRDLETICLKCLEKDPRRRYATAQAMADDLRAWLDHRPIAARRVGILERGRLWRKRRPAVAALSALVALATVGGTATVIVVQARANADLARSRADVQARYDLAVDAIKTFHTGVSGDFLLEQDQFKELRDRLLRSASDFYGKLGALLGNGTDVASRRALVAINGELAQLTADVGRREDALAAQRSVLAARRALAAEPGAGALAQAELGRTLTNVAILLVSTGKYDEALATYREAEALLAGPASESPEPRSALAACRVNRGALLSSIGKAEEALAAFRLARSDQETLVAAGASDQARFELANTLNHIGGLLSKTGRLKEAEAEYRAALAIRQQMGEQGRSAPRFRNGLAGNHNDLGILLHRMRRLGEAEAEYRKALEIEQRLADDQPAVTQFRTFLADVHNNLGGLLSQAGRREEAEAELRQALKFRRRLVEENPSVVEFLSSLAASHGNLGGLLTQTGRVERAEAQRRDAVAIHERLAGEYPHVTLFRNDLANHHINLGPLLRQTDRLAQAEPEFRAALAIRREMADRNPTVPDYRNDVASGHTNFADVVRLLGRSAEARDAYNRAIAIREALTRGVPRMAMYRSHLAYSLRGRGLARRGVGDFAGAAADARRALSLYETLPSRSEAEWYETACCHAEIAGLAGRAGSDVPAAEVSSGVHAAMSLLKKAVAMGYRNAATFRTEAALDSLRDLEDFRLLMMDPAMPDVPFAG